MPSVGWRDSIQNHFYPLALNSLYHIHFTTQAVGMSTRSTQTATQYVSIGIQTDNVPNSRGAGLHSKAWSPRPSSTTTSSLVSARNRQISTSLDKVHSRIERPCCSPKYGSPKLQRRVSSGNYIFFLSICFNQTSDFKDSVNLFYNFFAVYYLFACKSEISNCSL